MYYCTPSQLKKETGRHYIEMMQDLLCASVEARAARGRVNLAER
jgi:hypothetical protein